MDKELIVGKVVLIVDDVESSREILGDILEDIGCIPISAESGTRALELLEEKRPDIIISDIFMPDMDGITLCQRIKSNPLIKDIPLIFASADLSGAVCEGLKSGGDDFLNKPFYPEIVRKKLNTFFEIAKMREDREESSRVLHVTMREQLKRIEVEKRNVLNALTRVAKENFAFHDGHFERIAYNCRVLGEALQLSKEYGDVVSDSFIETVEVASPICDLGNVAIPSEILNKNGKLSEEELSIVRQHPVYGGNIIKDIMVIDNNNDYLQMSYEIACNHHEYYNGQGYPCGKKENEIPLSARIVSVISAYCAMTEPRPYRKAFEPEEAIKMIKEKAGEQFEPFLCKVMGLIVDSLK